MLKASPAANGRRDSSWSNRSSADAAASYRAEAGSLRFAPSHRRRRGASR
jgi:hypothetical protein